eukprot:scaffold3296_cov171-Amphora_coffeaeformis.AAC.3
MPAPFPGALITRDQPAHLGRLPINPKVREVVNNYSEFKITSKAFSLINPNSYVCEPGLVDAFFFEVSSSVDPENFSLLTETGALSWPFVFAFFFADDDTDVYLVDQKTTKLYGRRLAQLGKFWDIKFDYVSRRSISGSIIKDTEVMLEEEEIRSILTSVQDVIENDPNIGYDFPFFSFNAVAQPTDLTDPEAPPPLTAFGEGLLAYADFAGLDDTILTIVTAHEYGHLITLSGIVDVPRDFSPEGTRYIELMADVFAAYFGAHIKGATYQTKRVVETVRDLFDFGDCTFSSPGHHGTPNQRAAAATLGINLAKAAGPKIHTVQQVLDAFNAAFDDIIAIEKTTFPLTVSGTGESSSVVFEGEFLYDGSYSAEAYGLVSPIVTLGSVVQDPDQIFDPEDGFSSQYEFQLERAALFRVAVPPEAVSDFFVDLDVFLMDPDGFIVAASLNVFTDELIDVPMPADGTWTVFVQGWDTLSEESADFEMYTWAIPQASSGTLSVDPDESVLVSTDDAVKIEVSWTGADEEIWYLGAISHTVSEGADIPSGLLTVVEVDNRISDIFVN